MGPAFGLHLPPRQPLQAIIADGGRCPQSFFKVARLDEMPFLFRMVPPDTREAIRLQLHTNREGIRVGFGHLLTKPVHLFGNAE